MRIKKPFNNALLVVPHLYSDLFKRMEAQRRDTLSLVRKAGRERAAALRTAGNPGGARAIADLVRDLIGQLKAMHSL